MSSLLLRPGLGPRSYTSPLRRLPQKQLDENLTTEPTPDGQWFLEYAAKLEKPFAISGENNVQQKLEIRDDHEIEQLLFEGQAHGLRDDEVMMMVGRGQLQTHNLEQTLNDPERAIRLRRNILFGNPAPSTGMTRIDASRLPYEGYNWKRVYGACCENVIGYIPVPVGVAGPLLIDSKPFFIPMATTEGALVASTNRGCKAINASGGATTAITDDGMTRGPCVSFTNLKRTVIAKTWLDSEIGQKMTKEAFDSTSRFCRLQSIKSCIAGSCLYIRFKATTGDAMGMNMISKGVQSALQFMATKGGFKDMKVVSISGNYCADKKSSAVNWIEGRGKSILAEAMIPETVVIDVLKTDIDSLVDLNISKNLIGSAMAGSIGGFNAHAANIVSAIFLATGQDIAQVPESSNCMTVMKRVDDSLQISVTMPSVEVGTTGGGTDLEPQHAMLELLGVEGPNQSDPGCNARQLARIIGAATLAGELSLCSALASGHLVSAHMKYNRKNSRGLKVATDVGSRATPAAGDRG